MKKQLKKQIKRLGNEARIEMQYQNSRNSISRSYAKADMLYRKMNEIRERLNSL